MITPLNNLLRLLRYLPDRWACLAGVIATAVALPLLTLMLIAWQGESAPWAHLWQTLLPVYLRYTLLLVAGVALGTSLLGISTAWLVSQYQFPGRTLLSWALLLPLAVPSYILAFVITDQLEYAGTLQSTLRAVFGWQSAQAYWFFEIRSLGGAITVLSLVLYPYVYLLARAAFIEQADSLLSISTTLGRGPWYGFFTLALPLARPAIAVGILLALMETLNEYGTLAFFAVPTLTTGLFDLWFNQDNLSGATQLALLLMALALMLLVLEQFSRRRQARWQQGRFHRPIRRPVLQGGRAWAATLLCSLPVSLGFVLPAAVLCRYALQFHDTAAWLQYLHYTWNSLSLALTAACVTTAFGVMLAYSARLSRYPGIKGLTQLATLGYAIPGAVFAVGILYPLAWVDTHLTLWLNALPFVQLNTLIAGGATALILGSALRFIALSHRTIEASLTKITPTIEEAATTLGSSASHRLRRIHVPLMRPSLLVAVLLVFVDSLKELPITLILRPFNFETLATFVFQYASEELLEESALAALTIVAAGIVPVLWLSRSLEPRSPLESRS